MPMSMMELVQLPPMKFLMPLASAASITLRLTGQAQYPASSSMRSVEAASIQ